jgi:phage tail-like protein
MASEVKAPLVVHHFALEIEGINRGWFREVSGLTSESEVIEYKVSGKNGEEHVIKMPGRSKHSDVTCKTGMTDEMDLWNWRKQIEDGKFEESLKNGSIIMYDQQHNEVARWNFENAWPVKVEGPGLNSGGNEPAIETLVFTPRSLKRVK